MLASCHGRSISCLKPLKLVCFLGNDFLYFFLVFSHRLILLRLPSPSPCSPTRHVLRHSPVQPHRRSLLSALFFAWGWKFALPSPELLAWLSRH